MSDSTIQIGFEATGQAQLTNLTKQVNELGIKSETLTQKLGKQLMVSQSLESANASLSAVNSSLSGSYDILNTKVNTLDVNLEMLHKDLAKTNAALKASVAENNVAATSVNKHTTAVLSLAGAQRTLHDATRGVSGALGNLWMTYGQIMPLVTAFAATAAGMKIFKAGTEFEYLNTFSSALSEGAVKVEELNKSLLDMKGVAQTPTELAKGFLELQKAGVSSEASIQQLSTTARYAAVGQLELGAATEQLATITAAFAKTSRGASGDMLTVSDTADVVAFAAQKSTASFSDMQVAFRYMTGTAATAGFSIQEVASALMIMANHGLKGSMGATSLRTAFERLINPTDKASKLFLEAGGNMKAIYDDGKFKGIQSIAGELERLKGILSAKAWSEFSFSTFGLRGMQVNALVGDMAGLDKQLNNVASSAGFVDTTFSKLAETTKFKMKELEASFDRAFIKAFEGEKAREVIGDIQKLISGAGFASSLEQIATGMYGLGKGMAVVTEQFFKLPTWVAEVGLVGAFLFGLKGKLVLAGLIAAAEAIENINYALNNSIDITAGSLAGMTEYRNNLKESGKAYADIAEQIRQSKNKIEAMSVNPAADPFYTSSTDTAGIDKETAELKRLEEQLYNLSVARKSDTNAIEFSTEAANHSLNAMEEMAKRSKNWAKEVEQQDKKVGKDFGITEAEQNKLDAVKAGQEKLRSLSEQFSTYQENKDNESLAKKLVNLEKQYNANEALITKEKGSLELRAQNKKDYEDKVALLESSSAADNEKRLQEDLLKLETTENQAYDRRIAAAEAYHLKREAEILKTTKADSPERVKALNANDDIRTKAQIDALKKLGEEQLKVTLATEKFNDALIKMGDEAGIGGITELDKALRAVDLQIAAVLRDLKDTKGITPEVYEKGVESATALGKKLKDIQRAKLGDDIFAGFITGAKEAQAEVITLGKLGAEMGRELTSALSEAFSGVFDALSSENTNPFEDQMTSISDKIKAMQYESLEGGLAQLEYLRKEYDTTLQGAMSGNKEAFDAYMSNLDTYLAKAKEEMSPEEYAKVYAQTMDDLKKLNEDYAGQTEDTWDKLGDVWDSLMDRMKNKFMDLVAEMVAKDLMSAVFGTVTGSSSGSGMATTALGWIVNGIMGAGSSTATQGGQYQGWEAGAASNSGNNYGMGSGSGSSSSSGGGVGGVVGGLATTAVLNKIYNTVASAAYEATLKPAVDAAWNSVSESAIQGYEAASQYLSQAFETTGEAVSQGLSQGLEASGEVVATGIEASGEVVATGIEVAGETVASSAATQGGQYVGWEAGAAAGESGAGAAGAGAGGYATLLYMAWAAYRAFTKVGASSATRLNRTGLDPEGLISETGLSGDGRTEAITEAFKALDTGLQHFSTASLDTSANLLVLGAEVREVGDRGVETTVGMDYIVNSFNEATHTWEKTKVDFDAMVAQMQQIGPATAEAIGATAMYVASMNNVAVLSDELAIAYSQNQLGTDAFAQSIALIGGSFVDAAGTVISGMEMMQAAAAGFDVSGFMSETYAGEGHNFANNPDAIGDPGSESVGRATGGWIGKNGSGWINQGSGTRDDVFLGLTNGGKVANYGMGGEFVVNKRSAAKHAGLLGAINSDYADGGVLNSYGVPDKATTTFTAEAKESQRSDAVSIMDKVIELIRFDGISDYSRSLTELTENYAEQIKTVTELGGTEGDLALIRQAEAIELEALEKANQDKIDDIVKSSQELLDTHGLNDYQKSLRSLSESYKEQIDSLNVLGASVEELSIVEAARAQELADLEEQKFNSINDAMSSINDTLATSGLSEYDKQLRNINKTYADSISSLQALGASESQLSAARLAQSIEVANLNVSTAQTNMSDAESVLRAAYEASNKTINDTFSLLESSLNSSISSAQTSTSAANSRLSEIASALEKLSQADFLQREKYFRSTNDLTAKYQTGKLTSADLENVTSGTQDIREEYYTSSEAYKRDFYSMAVMLQTLQTEATNQLSQAEQFQAAQMSALASAQSTREQQLQANEDALNAILGISEDVPLTIEEATAAYLAAQQELANAESSLAELQLEAADYSNTLALATNYTLAEIQATINAIIPTNAAVAEAPRGPEYYSNTYSGMYSNNSEPMLRLASEISQLRQEQAAANLAIAANTARTAKQLSRWDGDGMPDTRV